MFCCCWILFGPLTTQGGGLWGSGGRVEYCRVVLRDFRWGSPGEALPEGRGIYILRNTMVVRTRKRGKGENEINISVKRKKNQRNAQYIPLPEGELRAPSSPLDGSSSPDTKLRMFSSGFFFLSFSGLWNVGSSTWIKICINYFVPYFWSD